jgi:hypothetical protein
MLSQQPALLSRIVMSSNSLRVPVPRVISNEHRARSREAESVYIVLAKALMKEVEKGGRTFM